MSDHPYFRAAGVVTGFATRIFGRIAKAVQPYARVLIAALLIIVVAPSVTEYWLRRTRIPDVPISAIVMLLAGSFFLLAFAAAIYAVTTCLIQIQSTERTVGVVQARRRKQYEETGGSFIPVSDEKSWQQEQIQELRKQGIRTDSIDLLRKNGILTDDDKAAIEEMAETAALKARGRTE